MAETTVSATVLRRLAIAAQGYAPACPARRRPPRSRRRSAGSPASSSTRSRPSSGATASRSRRASATTRRARSRACSRKGRIFEYWAHEACLLPVEDWPLFRASDGAAAAPWYGDVSSAAPATSPSRSSARSGSAGPLGSRALRGLGRGRDVELEAGEGDARSALEPRRARRSPAAQGFQRLYDLAERVIPRGAARRRRRRPRTSVLRALALRAVRARGALTAAGIVEHWRLRGRHRARSGRASTRSSRTGGSSGSRSTTAAPPCSSRRAPSSTGPRRARPCSSPPSTTCSGTGRSRGGCSASTT